jgi:hypothetical protein
MNLKQAKRLRKKLAYHPMLERSYDWIEFKDIKGGPSSYMCVNSPDSSRAVYQYGKKKITYEI